jgi:hypothetical protein
MAKGDIYRFNEEPALAIGLDASGISPPGFVTVKVLYDKNSPKHNGDIECWSLHRTKLLLQRRRDPRRVSFKL